MRNAMFALAFCSAALFAAPAMADYGYRGYGYNPGYRGGVGISVYRGGGVSFRYNAPVRGGYYGPVNSGYRYGDSLYNSYRPSYRVAPSYNYGGYGGYGYGGGFGGGYCPY